MTATISEIEQGMVPGKVERQGRLHIQPGVGGLIPLGGSEHRLPWTDDSGEAGWYHMRAYQTDGEMAWSSPVWVDRGRR